MCPSNGVMTWRPLLSTGSLGMVPPTLANDTMGRSDSPPSVSTRSNSSRADTTVSPVVCSPRSWASHRGPGSCGFRSPPPDLRWKHQGSLRFLGNPSRRLSVLFDPGGSGRLSGPRVSCLTRPPPVSTTKAPSVLYFRGSITRPLTSLSTLRRMGRPPTHRVATSLGCWSSFARRN